MSGDSQPHIEEIDDCRRPGSSCDGHSHGAIDTAVFASERGIWATGLRVEVKIAVPSDISVAAGHRIAETVQHEFLNRLSCLSRATIHPEPLES